MSEEQQLYKRQMELWLQEQQRLDEQLVRTVAHHREIAELNQEQLGLHRRKTALANKEFDAWLVSLVDQGGG